MASTGLSHCTRAPTTDIDVDEFEAFDKVTFGHIDYGVRLHLANSRRRWVPYGDITFTFWPVRDALKNGEKATTDFTSLSLASLGVGLAIHLSESWAVDVNFKGGEGGFSDVEIDNILTSGTSGHSHKFTDIDAASARLTLGVRGGRNWIAEVGSAEQEGSPEH